MTHAGLTQQVMGLSLAEPIGLAQAFWVSIGPTADDSLMCSGVEEAFRRVVKQASEVGVGHSPPRRGLSYRMAHVKVHFDRVGNTLTVWFEDPRNEVISEETGDEMILMKDREERAIGFEKLNFTATPDQPLDVVFEAVGMG